jgi:hypothetical protein
MSTHNPIEWTGNIQVHHPEKKPGEAKMNADINELPEYVRGHQLAKLEPPQESDEWDGEYSGEVVPADRLNEAEVVTSLTGEKKKDLLGFTAESMHRPILDIDIPMHIIPSTTEGHGHLYIDKEVSWSKYRRLLHALAECGIIERGYLNVSIAREHTAVRLPWVKKPAEAPLEALPL